MLPNNIFSTIVGILTSAWTAVYGWFSSLLTATHARSYIIGTIMAMLIVRFTVYPFFKGGIVNAGSSDSVVKSNPIRVSGGADRIALQPYNGKRLRIERK